MAAGLLPQTGSMSTLVTGEAQVVFASLHDAFLRAATHGLCGADRGASNACPVGGQGASAVGHL